MGARKRLTLLDRVVVLCMAHAWQQIVRGPRERVSAYYNVWCAPERKLAERCEGWVLGTMPAGLQSSPVVTESERVLVVDSWREMAARRWENAGESFAERPAPAPALALSQSPRLRVFGTRCGREQLASFCSTPRSAFVCSSCRLIFCACSGCVFASGASYSWNVVSVTAGKASTTSTRSM